MKNSDMENIHDVEATSGIEDVKKDLAELINIYEKNNLKSLPYGKCFKETLKMLDLANREFDAKLFFVLMFGALKAGKSTLTNLLARKYVSPTGFGIETTRRPSLIIKSREPGIDVYEALDTRKDDKEDLFNLVIDVLRGISDGRSLRNRGVNVKSMNWSDETVRKQLTQTLTIEPLITVLKVPGGDLLTEQVALIDMPGLDGVQSSWIGSYIHTSILKRADFLIFVQSSMAAVNESTVKFLNDAYMSSKKPPLCLVQNDIDAKHWRREEERKDERDKQCQRAREDIIGSLGISEELPSAQINLGQAWDGLEKPKEFSDLLKKSGFPEFEKDLEKLLNERRINIQRVNSVKGVGTAVNNCKQEFENYREKMKSDKKKYKDQLEALNEPKKIFENNISNAINKGIMKMPLKNRLEELVNEWVDRCDRELNEDNLFDKLSPQEATQDELEKKMKTAVDAINTLRTQDYLEGTIKYKNIINETTKKILQDIQGDNFERINGCLKELQIKTFDEKFSFKSEYKPSSFEPGISKMIKQVITFDIFKKTMKEKQFDKKIDSLRRKLREEYHDYAKKLLNTMINKISDEFDSWVEHSYKEAIVTHIDNETKKKKAEIEEEQAKITDALDWIETLEQKCNALAQSCNDALDKLNNE